MKVAVIGAGGVGAYFGGRLAETGHDVSFVVRGQHLEAINSKGLKVDSINGNIHIKPFATDDPAKIGEVDAVIVGVKAWQVPDVAVQIKPLVGKNTVILPLQNGIDAPEQLAEVYGKERALGGLCRIISFIVAPGHIAHTALEPSLVFGDMCGGECKQGKELLNALINAKINARISKDISVALWQKFTLIAPWGGVGAVARLSIGGIVQNAETRILLELAMKEVVAVGQAKGVAVPESTVSATIKSFDEMNPEGTASMQRDLLEGRPSELENQTGTIVRLGKEVGVPTPVNSFIYSCLVPHERKARNSVPNRQMSN